MLCDRFRELFLDKRGTLWLPVSTVSERETKWCRCPTVNRSCLVVASWRRMKPNDNIARWSRNSSPKAPPSSSAHRSARYWRFQSLISLHAVLWKWYLASSLLQLQVTQWKEVNCNNYLSHFCRAVFVRFALGGSEFRLATSDYSGHGGCQIGTVE